MENVDLLFLIAVITLSIVVFGISKTKLYRNNAKLRLLYLLPMLTAVLHIVMTRLEPCLSGIYLGCFLFVFLVVIRRWRPAVLIGAIALMLSSVIFCNVSSDYRSPGYASDFAKCFKQLRDAYVITAHKGIDWDALYEKYYPMFQMADEQRDVLLCYEAGAQFAEEFYDGHVGFHYGDSEEDIESLERQYQEKHCGLDYGFALVRRADDKVVFVNVDENGAAYKAGIRNGMEIEGIDGEDIDSVIDEDKMWFGPFPDRENKAFYAPLAATAAKQGTIAVSYRDTQGVLREADILGEGSFYERFINTKNRLEGSMETHNLTYYMVDDNTGCLVLNDMMVEENIGAATDAEEENTETENESGNTEAKEESTNIEDEQNGSNESENEQDESYLQLKKQVSYEIRELKRQGADNLIIDLRGNGGGKITMVSAVAGLFTDEPLFVASEGEFLPDGGCRVLYTETAMPDNQWGDGQIVVLVNAFSVSAAELLTHCLRQMDNVTVMGMTKSCGSAQATDGFSSGKMQISGSVMLMLDSDGEILIDSGTDHIHHLPLDVRIPLDRTAIESIFVDEEDYVLHCANDYLDGKWSGE